MSRTAEIFPYVVVLRNRHARYIDFVSLLICLCSAVLFLNEIIFTRKLGPLFLAGVLFVMLVIVYNLFFRKQRKKTHYNKALFIAAVMWLKMPYGQWLFLVLILMGLLERPARASVEIGFSKERIVFNYLFKRIFSWQEMQNVILRDNLITLDFKNNRLVQQEVEDEADEDDAPEEEFNAFCRQMLGQTVHDSENNHGRPDRNS